MTVVVVKFLVLSALIPLAIALGLILSQNVPEPGDPQAGGLDFSAVIRGGVQMPKSTGVTMRDGYDLQVREYPNADGPLVVLIHGSGWNGLQFNRLAPVLQADFQVLVPDLRGHGASPGRRGDVDYIGQLEDDLADLIKARAGPGQKIVLAGHSSGGGLVVRFAGGKHGDLLDGAVLMAPFLKYNAPTTRRNSGGWATPLIRRIIGLSMLNAVGIRVLNHLQVITFNMPQTVVDGPLGHLATTAYSYRMNVSFAPRSNYKKDIKALPPFLLLAGKQDEAFFADRFQALMSDVNAGGRYVLVPGTGHLGIVDAPGSAGTVTGFVNAL